MADEWRIRELVEQILESNSTPEEVCAQCPELLPNVRQWLERMNRVEQQVDVLFPSFSSASSNPNRAAHSPSNRLPQIDGYDVEAIVGRGGMGIVYRARHRKLKRIVALKMLVAGPYASPQEVARFVRESQAVAKLQHSNIVQVHDVGDQEGRPYFTMEFVDGGSLAQRLGGTPHGARPAAELVHSLAGAINLAHSKGIIHRDLKPANILLTSDAIPKIADFGLARHLDGDPSLTRSDARIGTPSYMAPEQALGRLGVIGTSVDIYALGAILYEMLTGRPPFRAETAIETERQVVTVEAAPPSRLNANVPRDLETICLKCLHKDPSRRYATAADLADDLQRFLKGRPVRARPVGWTERMWRWSKRNQGMAAALSGIAFLLMLIVAGSLWTANYFHALEIEHRKLAREKGNLAEQKARLAVETEHERKKAVEAEAREAGLRRQSEKQGQEVRRNLYLTEMNLAGQAAIAIGGLGRVSQLLSHWAEAPDLRNWEWFYLNSLCHRSEATHLGHTSGVHNVAWSPSGTRLASAGSDRTICIWDDSEQRSPLRLTGHSREVFCVAWSPDGQRLASASWDHSVRIWDTTSGIQLLSLLGHTAEVYSVAWSPDGSKIASSGRDQTIRIWDADAGDIKKVLQGHRETVSTVAWSPDSQRLASGSQDATVRLWDAADGEMKETLTTHTNWVNQVAFSPDGTRLASVSNDQTLRICDAQNGQELLNCLGHTKGVTALAWSPDSRQVASASDDRTVKVWIAGTGTVAFTLRGHMAPLTTVAWNPSESRLATAGYDGLVKVWDSTAGPENSPATRHENSVEALAWCEQQPTLCASADSAGTIKLWDMSQQTVRNSWRGDSHFIYSLAWHPAGNRLAAASGNGLIRIWTLDAVNEPQVLNAHSGTAYSVAWSPDGRRLATGGSDKTARIWNATTSTLLRTIENPGHNIYSVAWSPDGRRLAGAAANQMVKIWDSETGEEVFCYRGHTSQVTTVAWSPDGTHVASAGFDQTVQLWDVETGQRTTILRGHTSHIAQVIWSPDGSRLASACRDGRVKIWDTETGNEALTLESQSNQMNAVAWSPDGMTVATAAQDRQIRIYDATGGYVAARSTELLPSLDRRLAVDSLRAADWRLRGEIHARQQDWKQAAADLRRYLLLKPNLGWLIFDCLVAGPFSEDLSTPAAPELVDFFAVKSGTPNFTNAIAQVNWENVPCSAQGVVDFRPLMEHRDHVSAYAMFPVYSLIDQQVALLIGTDDQSRLWLNGQPIYECLRGREARPDEDAVTATLKTGWNSILVRVANEMQSHALYLRLSDAPADMARLRRPAP